MRSILFKFIISALSLILVVSCSDLKSSASSTPFISKWSFTSDNYFFELPIESGFEYNFEVDWGDGSEITSFDDPDKAHTYTTAGTYEITITGTIQSFRNDGA